MVRRIYIALVLLLATGLCSAPVWAEDGNEARADFIIATEGGKQLAVHSEVSPVQINRMHSWRLRLSDAAGAPVSGAEILVQGGMPEHDHGLPTQPAVTGEIAPGIYLLQGVRFHMPGRWLMEFSIRLNGDADSASLEFAL